VPSTTRRSASVMVPCTLMPRPTTRVRRSPVWREERGRGLRPPRFGVAFRARGRRLYKREPIRLPPDQSPDKLLRCTPSRHPANRGATVLRSAPSCAGARQARICKKGPGACVSAAGHGYARFGEEKIHLRHHPSRRVRFDSEQLGQSGQARKIRWPRCSKRSAETRNRRNMARKFSIARQRGFPALPYGPVHCPFLQASAPVTERRRSCKSGGGACLVGAAVFASRAKTRTVDVLIPRRLLIGTVRRFFGNRCRAWARIWLVWCAHFAFFPFAFADRTFALAAAAFFAREETLD
jgi:hypothetical protein